MSLTMGGAFGNVSTRWWSLGVAALGCAAEVGARHGDAGEGADVVMAVDAALDGATPCAEQLARPAALGALAANEAPSEAFVWRWSGVSCVEERYRTVRLRGQGAPSLPPRGCEGRDCGALFRAEADCVAAFRSCGARIEVPRRGPAFARATTGDIACGVVRCTVATGCYFGVVPGCGSPSQGWSGAGLGCDDNADCPSGTACCVADNGAYVTSACRAVCTAHEAHACVADGECGAGAWCCQAAAHLPSVSTSVGACTPRRCDPASRVDL